MTETKLYSRAQLVAISGAPEDAVVFWLRNGLLRPVEREGRQHRRFDRREVQIAAILREARQIGLNVGAMAAVVAGIRSAVEVYDFVARAPRAAIFDVIDEVRDKHVRESDPEKWEKYRKEMDSSDLWTGNPDDPWYEELIENGKISRDDVPTLLSIVDEFPVHRTAEFWLALNFVDANGLLVAGKDSSGKWSITHLSTEDSLPTPSAVVFDLWKVLELQWPKDGQL
jgi:DNA-binding transcriptional MerR regulator